VRALPRGTLSGARQVWRDLTERFKVLRVKNTFRSADAAETYGMMQVASRRWRRRGARGCHGVAWLGCNMYVGPCCNSLPNSSSSPTVVLSDDPTEAWREG
jgi:hypothetical protein